MSGTTEFLVENYLIATSAKYPIGAPEYYDRIALEEALAAHKEGNYGIGAVGVVVNEELVSEFPARNAMFTGIGVVDHAETRALLDIKSDKKPARTYSRELNNHTTALKEGITIYGSLEPCQMCASALTNAGAILSVSTVPDGNLVREADYLVSDGGATVLGEKRKLQPKVWQWIQAAIGLEFTLLETGDVELRELTRKIFEDYREEVDARLVGRALKSRL